MAVNLTNADNALKSIYLDVVSEQLNYQINPFFAAIKQSTNDVWGKEVKKLVVAGLNGGIGAGTEDGALPTATGNDYKQFVSTLKNLYGTIEISDKAIRASENNSGAFVNLLNAEMEGLIKSSTFNFGRMLFGNGSGALCEITDVNGTGFSVNNTAALMEGMPVEIYDAGEKLTYQDDLRITAVDRKNSVVYLNHDCTEDVGASGSIYIRNSYNQEITGLDAIFNSSVETLYGLNKAENEWLKPYEKINQGTITEADIQLCLDMIEEQSGGAVNFIVCSWGVRRALQKLFAESRRSIDMMELAGGFKAMSYNGIPIVADRFCPKGTMYFLNTNDFTLHQLCDWQWLAGDDGRVLKQVPGKPVYTATLVKYAELICSRPNGQGVISSITEE